MLQRKDLRVFHHRAPAGGLRTHKARLITYASSRRKLAQRHLPSVTEMYLAMRYLEAKEVRETIWLRVLGTFSARGGLLRRAAKCAVSMLLLPHTLWRMNKTGKVARQMLTNYPQIPTLPELQSNMPFQNDSVKPATGPADAGGSVPQDSVTKASSSAI